MVSPLCLQILCSPTCERVSLLQLAADKKLNTIIAWLKHKYPIGRCAIHPTEHCFFNKLGHWNLDLYKLFVWAVEIVSLSSRISRHYLTQNSRNAARQLERAL